MGELVWNRCSYIKDPRTGQTRCQAEPAREMGNAERPTVANCVRRVVGCRQRTAKRPSVRRMRPASSRKEIRPTNPLNASHRPRFLLSRLLRCGCCGGGYTIVAKDRYGCATRKQKGTCQNSRTITRQEIDARVLDGLKERLLEPELVAAFVEGFQADMARARAAETAERSRTAKKRMEIDRKLAALVRAIEDGLYQPSMKERMQELERGEGTLTTISPTTILALMWKSFFIRGSPPFTSAKSRT